MLNNSERRLLQAVHGRIRVPWRAERLPERVLGRLGYASSLRADRRDIGRLRSALAKDGPAVAAALDALESFAARRSALDPEEAAEALRGVAPEALLAAGQGLVELREDELAELDREWAPLVERLAVRAPDPERGADGRATAAEDTAGFAELPSEGDLAGRVLRRVTRGPLPEPRPAPAKDAPRGAAGRAAAGRGEVLADAPEREELRWIAPPPPRSAPLAARAPATLDEVLQLEDRGGAAAPLIRLVAAAARRSGISPMVLRSGDARWLLVEELAHLVTLNKGFAKTLQPPKVDPVGLLHLERLSFTPAGIERGELVHSVPLAPDEEVSIAHKEWSNTTEEFERIVTDFLEEYSEEGVAEKSELAQATSSQRQHSQGFNVGVTATGGYGPVHITTTAGVNVADSASSSEQSSRDQSISVTRKASSRVRKEHKTSFKVVTSSGSEDQTVRRFKNPFPDKATRVDYYQLVRKWRVAVHRYGLRLTWDLTVPEPGSDVLARILEIQAIQESLQQGFGPDAPQAWARFDLQPGQLTRSNYTALAAYYNATAPQPPPAWAWYDESRTHKWNSQEEAEHNQYHELSLEVDPDYAIDQVTVDKNETHWEDETHWLSTQSVSDFMGKSGKRVLVYATKNLASAYVELRVRASLRGDAFAAWQVSAWTAMRDAAQARYYERRQALQERLTELESRLGGDDALSLRKLEREEIMKSVLRWLFGPDFYFVPQGTPADLYDAAETVKSDYQWSRTLAHGKLITFLHQAVEWENVLYFLYPYFWSHLSRWELKKSLDHPDPVHRAFLKSGSARVVLTIRPGFERDFLALVETGSFQALPQNHPYVTIVEEMEAYARTNYPGIPPANPEQADEDERGVEVGSWHEYTPTSALDIAFGETLPTA